MFLLVLSIILFVVKYQRKVYQKEVALKELENEKQRAVFAAAFEAEERQKEAIAGNLHDTINPSLSLAVSTLETLYQPMSATQVTETTAHVTGLIDSSIQGIREACFDLVPQTLRHMGLFKALEHLVFNIRRAGKTSAIFSLHNPGHIAEDRLKPFQLNVFRITQELLNNILKHSGASRINVNLMLQDSALVLEISFNGRGISDEDVAALAPRGFGLRSVQSRALLLKGEVKYRKEVEGMNYSTLVVPLVG
jgi:two-component system, NarL family, sensor kinase